MSEGLHIFFLLGDFQNVDHRRSETKELTRKKIK